MSDTLPSGEIIELIRGQARLETKIDQFMSQQSTMRTEIDAIKADITEMKTASVTTKGYVKAVVGVVGVVYGGFVVFIWPWVQKHFALG